MANGRGILNFRKNASAESILESLVARCEFLFANIAEYDAANGYPGHRHGCPMNDRRKHLYDLQELAQHMARLQGVELYQGFPNKVWQARRKQKKVLDNS